MGIPELSGLNRRHIDICSWARLFEMYSSIYPSKFSSQHTICCVTISWVYNTITYYDTSPDMMSSYVAVIILASCEIDTNRNVLWLFWIIPYFNLHINDVFLVTNLAFCSDGNDKRRTWLGLGMVDIVVVITPSWKRISTITGYFTYLIPPAPFCIIFSR